MGEEIVRRVAIAGNPNTGKSTIFNALTGLRQKVGNYPGVTVEKKTGRFFGSHGESMELIDLPGSYSLQVRSPDEAVARDLLLGRIQGTPRPDVIIAVVDASNLERHLYLAAQMLELGIPVVVALNMVDVAEARGLVIDLVALKERLGVPVVPMVASKGTGLIELKQALSRPLTKTDHRAQLPIVFEREVAALGKRLDCPADTARLEGMLLLSLDERGIAEHPMSPEIRSEVTEAQARLRTHGIDPLAAPVDARYDWVGEVCMASIHRKGEGADGLTVSDRVDRVLIHKVWGTVAFVLMMALMFVCIFFVADKPMGWIDDGFGWLADSAKELFAKWNMSGSDVESLVADGIIGGVGGVVIFLPQILILFFFLGLLEDSGYMARAAFIMDRLMSRVGLHGKSFVPLLSSFACAIPGIMATRTIENRKDRLVTILVAPLMSCSARLPVYVVMIALLLPAASSFERAGIMLIMYLIGIIAAMGMAALFKKTLLRGETPMLLLELPPYRRPVLRGILQRMWERGLIFLRRAGTVILALSIVLWALLTYPKPANPEATESEKLEHSIGGRMGRAIEPAVAPLGYDWKIGIALVASFAAREVFVATMGQIYNLEDVDEESESLREQMHAEKRPDGSPLFTPLVCISLMVFYVLAMQCISTVAIVKRETGGWRWPLFQVAYMTVLAWLGAFVVYQGGKLLGFQ
jgi:ferrous iron transport protein B